MRGPLIRLSALGACLLLGACGQGSAAGDSSGSSKGPAVASAASADVTGGPAETTSSGAPKRRDGWWEITRLAADGSVIVTQYLCVGAGSEEKYNILTQINVTGDDCSTKLLTRTAAGWTFHSKCQVAVTKTEASGAISGDFRTNLRVDGTLVTDGAQDKMSVRGTWKGPCPAGRRPGDLVNGDFTANILG